MFLTILTTEFEGSRPMLGYMALPSFALEISWTFKLVFSRGTGLEDKELHVVFLMYEEKVFS